MTDYRIRVYHFTMKVGKLALFLKLDSNFWYNDGEDIIVTKVPDTISMTKMNIDEKEYKDSQESKFKFSLLH